jgi:membrane-bound serine protease (ClpP class)
VEYWVWSLICLGIAVVLFVLEILVPTGGIATILCAIAVVAAVVLAFFSNTTLGMLGLMGALVALAVAPFVITKIMPDTPIARLLTLHNDPMSEAHAKGIAGTEAAEIASELVGTQGKAMTDLRPVGTCLINNERRDCLAEGGIILAGRKIKVVAADGMQIKVREIG